MSETHNPEDEPCEQYKELRHRGGSPCKLRLNALEQDVLFSHLMETLDETDDAYAAVLGDIMDRMPEEDILSRPPSMETLVEIGYFDQPLASFDAPVVADSPSSPPSPDTGGQTRDWRVDCNDCDSGYTPKGSERPSKCYECGSEDVDVEVLN